MDLPPKDLLNKCYELADYLNLRKYILSSIEELRERVDFFQKKNRLLIQELQKISKQNSITSIEEKNINKVISDIDIEILKLREFIELIGARKEYASAELEDYFNKVIEYLGAGENQLEELKKKHKRPDESTPEIMTIEQEKIKFEFNQNDISLKENMTRLKVLEFQNNFDINFEEKFLHKIASEWNDLQESKRHTESESKDISKYQQVLKKERMLIEGLKTALIRHNDERKTKRGEIILKTCQKCFGFGCNDCNNGFLS